MDWVVIATNVQGQALVIYPGELDAGEDEATKKTKVQAAATAAGLVNPTVVLLSSLTLNETYVDAWERSGDQIVVNATKALASAKARRKAEVDTLKDTKLDAGTTYAGVAVSLDKDTQTTLAGLLLQAIALGVNFPGYTYRAPAGGSIVLATAADVVTMTQTLAGTAATLDGVAWGHKDAIQALGSAAAVDAYNITAGW